VKVVMRDWRDGPGRRDRPAGTSRTFARLGGAAFLAAAVLGAARPGFSAFVGSARAAKPAGPEAASSYDEQGDAAGRLGRYGEAISAFTKALAIEPDVRAYLGRGLAYEQSRRYDAAILDFTRAIALNSNLAEAYDSRGVAYDQKGLYARAVDDYDRAIALKADFAEAYFNRGAAFEHQRRYARAVLDYRAALGLDPGLAAAAEGLRRLNDRK
jgi:tetratricopeptide (TPR) repeat protein